MRWLIALTAALLWVDVAVAADGGSSTSAPTAYEYPCTEVDAGLIQQVAVSVDTLNRTIAVLENVSGLTLPGAVKVPIAFVPALLKDFDTARSSGPLSPLTSQTLEQVGRFGLKTLPGLVDALKAEGRLPAEFKIPPTTFGVPDLTAAVASHFGSGRLGVEQVTLYLDGISKMTAAAAGMLAGGPRGAKIAESAAGLAQVTLRGLTMPLFQEHFNKPVRQEMEHNWRALQESRIAHGQPVRRFSEMFGGGRLTEVGFDARRIGELDRYADWANATQGGTRLDARLPAPVVGPRMIVDIPGVNWTGGPREADWGTLLRPGRTTIYVRHQGPGLDRWDVPERGTVVVLLPPKFDAKTADAQLLPHLRAAFAGGRDVHVVVDTNITLARHVLPLPKPEEDRWAADVTRYVSRQMPATYGADLAEHSRGTVTNRYLAPADLGRFQNIYISSPRGDDSLSWVSRTPNRPHTYIITGVSDAPSWRWNESLSSLRALPNVLVIERRDLHGPATTHSLLQNLDSAGAWRVMSGAGDSEFRGSLRQVLAHRACRSRSRRRRPGPAESVSAAVRLIARARRSRKRSTASSARPPNEPGPPADARVPRAGRRGDGSRLPQPAASRAAADRHGTAAQRSAARRNPPSRAAEGRGPPPAPTPVPPRVAAKREPPVSDLLTEIGDRCRKGRHDLLSSAPGPSGTHARGGRRPERDPWSARPVAHVSNDSAPAGTAVAQAVAPTPRKIGSLERLGRLADIDVAWYRRDRSELVVIGPPSAEGSGLSFDDWRAVFRAVAFGFAPGVSIDPGPDTDRMVVRYFGGIEKTHLGFTLFEADRTLKLLSTGFDNVSCERVAERLGGLPTELSLIESEVRRSGSLSPGGWHRFWFEPAEQEVETAPNRVSIQVPARRLIVREQALEGSGGRASAREFAETISREFPALAAKIPAFAQLHRQAALVHLAKWMIDRQVPIDEAWLATPATVDTAATTPSITVTRASIASRTYLRIGIYGGVDFRPPNRYVAKTGGADRLAAAAERQETAEASWDFQADGRGLRAVRLTYERPIVVSARGTSWSPPTVAPIALPSPYLVKLPEPDELSRQHAGSTAACPRSTGASAFVVRGEAYVWDQTKGGPDVAQTLLPEKLRAGGASGRLTLFIVHGRGQVEVGRYTISRQPAYREHLDVAAVHWPEGVCKGTTRLDGGPPPARRPVQYTPGYGASVSLAKWIEGLPREH